MKNKILKDKIVRELVKTRINGNSINKCKTYTNMIKRVTKSNILNCSYNWHNASLQGSKLEMIEELKNMFMKSEIV